MNILYFVSDGILEYNSSHFRVTLQANSLKDAGLANTRILNIREWLTKSQEGMISSSWADIIIIQRVMLAESIEVAESWIKRGKKVLVDFDDAYDLIGPENAAYPFWGKGEVEISTQYGTKYKRLADRHPVDEFKDGLSRISGAIVPSEQLCLDWKKYNNIYRIENYLDTERYHKVRTKKNNRDVKTIGWGGSLSHLTSFSQSGVQEALGHILSTRKDVELLIVGDKRVLKQLPFSNDKVRFLPYVMWRDWPKILNMYDIGLAPLAGKYDARRSGLKPEEYICMGIPFVATNGMPYQDLLKCPSGTFVNQGSTSDLEMKNAEGWVQSLTKVLDGNYFPIAERAIKEYDYLYDATKNANKIASVYQKILGD